MLQRYLIFITEIAVKPVADALCFLIVSHGPSRLPFPLLRSPPENLRHLLSRHYSCVCFISGAQFFIALLRVFPAGRAVAFRKIKIGGAAGVHSDHLPVHKLQYNGFSRGIGNSQMMADAARCMDIIFFKHAIASSTVAA